MRLVIDTNIWVSGLLWRGDAWRLLNLAEQGKVELCIAHSMLLELEEVLAALVTGTATSLRHPREACPREGGGRGSRSG